MEESWPSQPKVDFRYLKYKHVSPRAGLLDVRSASQHMAWELNRNKMLEFNPKPGESLEGGAEGSVLTSSPSDSSMG